MFVLLVLWVTCQVHVQLTDNVATNFNCCRIICAEPQQRQCEQQFFIIELLQGLPRWRVPYSLVCMRFAQVTLLRTALTRLTATSCLELSAGSVGKLSLQRTGGMLQ